MTRFLYFRLALAMCLLFIAVGGALIAISKQTSERYSLEVTQRINRDIALHAAEDMPLFQDGRVNDVAVKELAHHVMFINPIVEVYLLDPAGKVLSHALPYETVVRERVEMAPLHSFLEGEQALPIFGDDPRDSERRKVFSVSPILEEGEPIAYLYTVLNGQDHDSLSASLQDSYNLRAGSATIMASLLVALLAGFFLFALLTRRLNKLVVAVRQYREGSYQGKIELSPREPARDEIDELTVAIAEMSGRIENQFSAQQEIDRTRRELIANVSHDLRTPIASMQGYLETILVKQLPEDDARRYLRTAHKHALRLNELIGELFELSKLESSAIEPEWEEFPLMELIQDLVQDHQILAREKGITLSAHCVDTKLSVRADIALIHRALENLVNNALRHTPSGGNIRIQVSAHADRVRVEVEDDGEGIASHDIPHIFERFYRPENGPEEQGSSGHGLGLAIVKRIVELHASQVAVRSERNSGTVFSFWLPQAGYAA